MPLTSTIESITVPFSRVSGNFDRQARWMLSHSSYRDRSEAYSHAFSKAVHPGVDEEFIRMFTNEDSIDLAPECLEALRLLYSRAGKAGLVPDVPEPEVVGASMEVPA